MAASGNGHIEAIKALLTAPDININHATVSLYLLRLPNLVVEGGCEGLNLALSLTLILVTYHPLPLPLPASNPICMGNPPFILYLTLFLFPYSGRAPQP